MTEIQMSGTFLSAPWLKERDVKVEFVLPFSETVRALIKSECFEGEGASYDFSVAARSVALGQIDKLKAYVNRYGIDLADSSYEIPEGELSQEDLGKYKEYKEHLEKIAMTLAQLEEDAMARHPETEQDDVKDKFRAMIGSNYEAKKSSDGYGGLHLDVLKQVLYDVQSWEFNGRVLSQADDLYPALSYHVSSGDTQTERDNTISQIDLICQDVATRYDLGAFKELSDKFPEAGVSEDLIRSRKGMKEVIEAIAFSLHILEERKVAEYKDRDPSLTADQIEDFRGSVRQEIGAQYAGEEFACPDGTYENLQGILKRIQSGESFESLLVHAKRAFVENLASAMLDELARDEYAEQSVHVVPYIINTIADVWGLKMKDEMEDLYSGTYDSFIEDSEDFIKDFNYKLTQELDSESFTRVIAENLSNGIMGKISMDLPNFTEYESPEDGGWINVEANFGAVRDRQDDYVADALSVFAKFGIDKYFGEDKDAQEESMRTILFKNTLSEDSEKMKVEVRYNDFLKFASFACMYKMASYDPSLITGVSKEVFQVPLRVHEHLMKQNLDAPPSIDPSVVLDRFQSGSPDRELALYEMFRVALDSDVKIGKDGSLQAPMDYLLELGDVSPGVLRRYLSEVNGIPPLPALMWIVGRKDAMELLRLCSVFRDDRDDKLDEVFGAVSLLQRMQTPGYVAQEDDFSSLLPLFNHYSIDEIKYTLSPELETPFAAFTERSIEDAIESVTKNGLALENFAPWLRGNDRVVLAAVTQNWEALQYADESLKKNEEIVLAAIKQDGRALEFADESLKKDPKIVLAAITQYWEALQFADKSLRSNEKIVLAAVEQDGGALEFADEALKRDPKIVLAAVEQKGSALEFADEALKENKEMVLVAVKKDGYALDYADEALKKDPKIVLAAVKKDGLALWFADESLKKDPKIVLAAVEQKGSALEFADEALKKDPKIVLAAVKKDGYALDYADEALKKDPKIVLAAVEQGGGALDYADKSLRGNKEIVLAAITQEGRTLAFADISLKKNPEIVLAAVRQNPKALQYASDNLKKDKDIAFVALMNAPSSFTKIHEDLRGGRDPTEFLNYLKDEIVANLPEQYRTGAQELLGTGAYISSEIPFVLEEPSFSNVFKMEWARDKPASQNSGAYVESYRDNLSKLLAMKVILQLCDGNIHDEKFAQLCKKENINSLSADIHSGLENLSIEALTDIFYRADEVAAGRRTPASVAAAGTLPIDERTSSLTQLAHDALSSAAGSTLTTLSQVSPTVIAAAAQRGHEDVAMPHIELPERFFQTYTQEHSPSEGQQLQV